MDSLSEVSSTGRSVLIGIPLREDESRYAHVDARFAVSLLANVTTLANAGIPVNVHLAVSPGLGLDQARNLTVQLFLEQTTATHLFFWDCDTLLLPDAILTLLNRKLPIVSGLYMQRGMSHRPVILDLTLEGKKVSDFKYRYQDISEVPDNELVEVGATPGGIFLTERSVFEKITPPWFAFPKHVRFVGEDIFFSLRVTEAGYKHYVDTSVEGIHLVQHPAGSQQIFDKWEKAYGYKITPPT
jgi:GT2 family glycosyltransferase